MKNIMFISSNYPPRIGGPATTVPQLAKRLSKTPNYNLSVVAFREKKTKRFEKTGFELYRSPSCYLFGFSNPFSVAIRTVLISFFSRCVAYKKNPKIIHAHDTHISAIAAIFTKITSLKKRIVIVKYAGDLVLEFSGLRENKGKSIEEILKNPSLKQKILFKIQKTIFSLSDFVHVQNEYQKNIAATFYNIPLQKIVVIPNPVDLTRFGTKKALPKKEGKKKFVMLTVSRLVPWKGSAIAIKAMPKILAKIPNCELRIIGSGTSEFEKKLKDLSKSQGVEKNIVFLGKIPHDKLPGYYASCDLFLQPSLYEPFGITVIEALACNKPVIASDTGGLPELIKNGVNGYIAKANSSKSLVEKIILAKRNMRKFNTNKKSFVKKYNIDAITTKLAQMYDLVLK
jgi:glycosyltransferase involved in cell wall biosynthesis